MNKDSKERLKKHSILFLKKPSKTPKLFIEHKPDSIKHSKESHRILWLPSRSSRTQACCRAIPAHWITSLHTVR